MHDTLQPHQYALVKALGEGVDDPRIEHLAEVTGMDQALVSAAATELSTPPLMVRPVLPTHLT